ncbi:LysR family transcriptional regulator [Granulicella sp. WH15]|uniref:LysR substrate-binding domain-containing protein n=1 Tax=Granulicella sp. WH15 TaxID=2602070 RepID=UPI0013668CB5|nr:LysR substrate-binding domain-containing protein [Granulicella sp. WH15]QHN04899.1 LysR family transcriptional regulator [Granulicella sp. WH15]
MELRHLRYFLAVADELSFRGAAEKLHVAQPSLSSQIRLLEEEMEVRLLERDTHRVTLTPAGRSFLESCRRTLRAVDDDTRTAQSIARGEAGRISIGFVASLGLGLLPGILREYSRQFPKIELEINEMDSTQQIKALQEHRLDLGLIGLGLSSDEMSDLRMATVVEEKLYAAVPQDHPLAKAARRSSRPLPLARLANESFFFGARSSAPVFNPWLVVLCHEAGFQPHIRQEAGQPITVLNYVAAGLGVTILPAQFCRLQMVGVTFIPLAAPVPSYRYSAAWSANNRHPAVPHLVQVAQEAARKLARSDTATDNKRTATKQTGRR